MNSGVPQTHEWRFSDALAGGKTLRVGLLLLGLLSTLLFSSSALGAAAPAGLGSAASFSVFDNPLDASPLSLSANQVAGSGLATAPASGSLQAQVVARSLFAGVPGTGRPEPTGASVTASTTTGVSRSPSTQPFTGDAFLTGHDATIANDRVLVRFRTGVPQARASQTRQSTGSLHVYAISNEAVEPALYRSPAVEPSVKAG